MGKPERKRILGGPRLRWEHFNKLDFQDVGCGVIDCIEVVQDRTVGGQVLVNAVMCFVLHKMRGIS